MQFIDKLVVELSRRLKRIPLRVKREFLIKNDLLEIGAFTYGYENADFQYYKGSETKVTIGKFCSIGPDVRFILGGIHPADWVSTFPFRAQFNLSGKNEDGMPKTNGPILIGHDVWIGTNVTILSGVTIGHGAIVASGAVVTKNVEPYEIVGGVPSKVIGKRFSEEITSRLLELKWWDWHIDEIIQNIDLLSSQSIYNFFKKHNV